jgi:hypothetical protein
MFDKKKRHFTRAQVEARCLEIHPPSDEYETVRVLDVALIQGTPLPMWEVRVERVYKEGTRFEHRFRALDIYAEERILDDLVLLPYTSVSLPVGYATVEEEDRAIEERRRDGRDV